MAQDLDYRALSDELETIVMALQQDDIDVDLAMAKYERGLGLIKQLESYLKTAENKVKKLGKAEG
jgi:exodeoxyribonuclease VII small subunit